MNILKKFLPEGKSNCVLFSCELVPLYFCLAEWRKVSSVLRMSSAAAMMPFRSCLCINVTEGHNSLCFIRAVRILVAAHIPSVWVVLSACGDRGHRDTIRTKACQNVYKTVRAQTDASKSEWIFLVTSVWVCNTVCRTQQTNYYYIRSIWLLVRRKPKSHHIWRETASGSVVRTVSPIHPSLSLVSHAP